MEVAINALKSISIPKMEEIAEKVTNLCDKKNRQKVDTLYVETPCTRKMVTNGVNKEVQQVVLQMQKKCHSENDTTKLAN